MKRLLCVLILGMIMPANGWAEKKSRWSIVRQTVRTDYANFYTIRNLGYLAIGLGGGAVLAHTDADTEIQQWSQQSLKNETTADIVRIVKSFGNGRITVPLFAGAALFGLVSDDTSIGTIIGTWGHRSLRALLVGVPPLLLLQKATGASRPNEANSHWQPFEDDNGVSGHSFMGAVPFLSAAMMTEKRSLKILLYTSSTFCGLSRIHDDKHYFSQVALGWWLAYLSAKSVSYTKRDVERIDVTPLAWQHGIGLNVNIRF